MCALEAGEHQHHGWVLLQRWALTLQPSLRPQQPS